MQFDRVFLGEKSVALVDHALDPVLELLPIEINQEPLWGIEQVEVGQYLRGVDRQQPFDAFHLDDQSAFDQEVDPVAETGVDVPVSKGNGDLSRIADLPVPKLNRETALIRAFQ